MIKPELSGQLFFGLFGLVGLSALAAGPWTVLTIANRAHEKAVPNPQTAGQGTDVAPALSQQKPTASEDQAAPDSGQGFDY